MYPSITFTFEKPEIIYENEKKVQVLNFFDVNLTLRQLSWNWYLLQTDDTHDYLPYDNAHPDLDHTKNNIPYNLAKRIIVFVSTPEKVSIRLNEVRE